MTDAFQFVLPWIPASKKNAHAAFHNRVVLRTAAKREVQAIRDCARAAIAHQRGALDNAEMEDFMRDAIHYRNGNITPKAWEKRCEALEQFRMWGRDPVEVHVEFFRGHGAATEGSTRIMVRRYPWSIVGDVRRMTDVDGSATTIMDALGTVFYANDKQVEQLVATRYREEPETAVTARSPESRAVLPQ